MRACVRACKTTLCTIIYNNAMKLELDITEYEDKNVFFFFFFINCTDELFTLKQRVCVSVAQW